MSEILSKHFKKGVFCVVKKNLIASELNMGEHGDEVMIYEGKIVKVETPNIIKGWTGTQFPRSIVQWVPVDIPTEQLTPLNITSLLTIIIPHAIANIRLVKK